MIDIPRNVYENMSLFERQVNELKIETEEFKKILRNCVDNQARLEARLDNFKWISPEEYDESNTYDILDRCTIHNDRSYEDLTMLIGSMRLDWLSPVVACTNADGVKYRKRLPLSYVVQRINHLIKNTHIFTYEDSVLVKSLENRVNKMWDDADKQIQQMNFFVRIFHEIRKLFSWKVPLEIPDNVRNMKHENYVPSFLL
jgi:regulator of replication initiation timing